jgi:hypothetical protein
MMIQSGFLEKNCKIQQLQKKDMVGFVQMVGIAVISQVLQKNEYFKEMT